MVTHITIRPDNNLSTGQSISSDSLVQSTAQAYMAQSLAPSTSPQQAIDGNADAGTLRFPSEELRYYMKFVISDYKRDSWRSVGSLNQIGSFVLPMPGMLTDQHQILFDVQNIGAVGAAAMAATQDATALAQNILARKGTAAWESTKSLVSKAGNELGGSGGAERALTGVALGAAGAIGQGVMAASGMAVNQFLTVMLQGPNYKSRQFHWKLSPQNSSESENLRKIIAIANDAMAPELPAGLGSIFFNYPKLWQVSFVAASGVDMSKTLFKMKPSFLRGASFNYSPNGIPAFFGSTSMPESIDITFDFLEVEFWLKGDFESGI